MQNDSLVPKKIDIPCWSNKSAQVLFVEDEPHNSRYWGGGWNWTGSGNNGLEVALPPYLDQPPKKSYGQQFARAFNNTLG